MILMGSFASVFAFTFICVKAHFVHLWDNSSHYCGTVNDLGVNDLGDH